MTAYAFVTLTIDTPETFDQYRELAGPAMKRHGGAPVEVSRAPDVIEGDGPTPDIAVLLGFPDRDAALGWINDPEIAEVHALRRASGTSKIVLL